MYCLGIETSCDETSASVVLDGRKVVSCETASSIALHSKYGGIVPEIASRKQLETIAWVTKLAVTKAKIKPYDLGLVCFTKEPGLPGSVVVGGAFAESAAFALNIPVIGVNHLHAHIYGAFLNGNKISLPVISLIVSGGHTSLFYVKDFDKINLLGSTQDDACGEAFDKVAKIMGLSYPGGPLIEKLALKGDPKRIKFGCSKTKGQLDFSFSGIKTAVLYHIERLKKIQSEGPDKNQLSDIAASFQEACFNVIVEKSFLACKKYGCKKLVAGGGVAANNRLREMFNFSAQNTGIKVYFPEKYFCMDNAAMVGGFGYRLYKKGAFNNVN
ncbi:MAG: tRNA (adenosine(37)-N6)-threonylcarbamoyltransferase complex transferase subunit TsaD [Candidatus Omnitrophica bacterium]|nr:tRNA (adenosine(37)-N6)-threonylcarbamoyltransferase complex transferase subunit TsaD [Candidatus Omnitrophota bacterium]